MTEIVSYDIAFSSSFGGGSTIKGYLARPEPEIAGPAILVVHDVFGLDEHIKETCRKLAEAGFIALAPDLYTREKGPGELPDWNAQLRRLQATPDARVLEDLKGAATYLNSVGTNKIGLLGFGIGATWAFLLSCDIAGFVGAALYYPIIVREAGAYKRLPVDNIQELSAPILSLFGDSDELVPLRDVRRLEAEMKKQGKPCDIKVYEKTKGSFANPQIKDCYNAEAAANAWKLALEFLAKNLRA